MQVDYLASATGGSRRFRLQWAAPDGGKTVAADVETARIYTRYDITNAATLTVNYAGTNASASYMVGGGLSLATVGTAASFSISTRDSFGNTRTLDEDTWHIRLDGPVRTYNFKPTAVSSGVYSVSYAVSEAGLYNIQVRRPSAGGLVGEYFNNMWLSGAADETNVDGTINFSWGSGTITGRAAGSAVMGSSFASVRWSGMLKADLTDTFTFYGAVNDAVSLLAPPTLIPPPSVPPLH